MLTMFGDQVKIFPLQNIAFIYTCSVHGPRGYVSGACANR
ncbi:hypothetical protein SAMN05444172_8248 [Burkholderia sp. GAS332]|nr:hypothetical protein SAMN05444172_8248 [Burkholderia sp. GAS332]